MYFIEIIRVGRAFEFQDPFRFGLNCGINHHVVPCHDNQFGVVELAHPEIEGRRSRPASARLHMWSYSNAGEQGGELLFHGTALCRLRRITPREIAKKRASQIVRRTEAVVIGEPHWRAARSGTSRRGRVHRSQGGVHAGKVEVRAGERDRGRADRRFAARRQPRISDLADSSTRPECRWQRPLCRVDVHAQ